MGVAVWGNKNYQYMSYVQLYVQLSLWSQIMLRLVNIWDFFSSTKSWVTLASCILQLISL